MKTASKKLLALLLCLTLFCALGAQGFADGCGCCEKCCCQNCGGGAPADTSNYSLKQVVVLSRHNIRSPLSEKGSVLDEITPHEWFQWTSNPGELSLRGAMLETTMGQYFRLWLENEGLFPENYIPKDGAVRFYANGYQRTQATAHYFSAGLLPVAVVPVERHVDYNSVDGVFVPVLTFMNDAYEADIRAEVAERGGGEGLSGYSESLRDAISLLIEVADMEESEAYRSGAYGNLLEDPDELKAAFGHELSFEDWRTIGKVLATYEEILFSAPSAAVNEANPMLKELYAELNAQGREFSFLCGHDSTVTSVLAALGVEDYETTGAIHPTTPIGCKVVFERWVNEKGASFFKVNLVYQSVDQLRSIQPLSLEVPPMIIPLSFEGVAVNADGLIAEKDLMNLFLEKISLNNEMIDAYTAEEFEAAA